MSEASLRRRLVPPTLFAGTLAFYVVHLGPSTTWGDSASLHRAIDQPLGIGARGYPLFVLAERLVRSFPTNDVFTNANLLTALFAALAVVAIYGIVLRLTRRPSAAVCGAVSFAVAHTVWTYAVITEVYSLNHLVIAAMLWLMLEFRAGRRWALPALFLIAGLATAHHRLLGFMALPVLLFFALHLRRMTPRLVLACAAAFLAGATPLIVLALRALDAGAAPADLARLYLTAGTSKPLFDADPAALARGTGLFGAYLAYNFVGLALPLAVAGVVSLWRRDKPAFALLATVFLAYAVFAIGYRRHGIWVAYGTHAYLPVAVLVGLGASACLRRVRGSRAMAAGALVLATAAAPIAVYATLPAILDRLDARPFRVVDAPAFHRWYLDPARHGDPAPPETARAILAAVPDDAVVLGDWGVIALLRLLHERDGGPATLRLALYGGEPCDARLDRLGPDRPIYLVHLPWYAPTLDTERYVLEPVDGGLPLLRVRPRGGGR
jgi:hypothetical protein